MSEQDFAQALELYRTNYVQYRTTGRSEYKIAYENAERWIQLYLEQFTNQITSGREFVNTFLRNYSTANPDMETLRTRFQTIRTEGPKIEDEYLTLKRLNEQTPEPESTSYYVKAGILAGLLGSIFVLNVL
jgi:hypothetical protein